MTPLKRTNLEVSEHSSFQLLKKNIFKRTLKIRQKAISSIIDKTRMLSNLQMPPLLNDMKFGVRKNKLAGQILCKITDPLEKNGVYFFCSTYMYVYFDIFCTVCSTNFVPYFIKY